MPNDAKDKMEKYQINVDLFYIKTLTSLPRNQLFTNGICKNIKRNVIILLCWQQLIIIIVTIVHTKIAAK